jgi:hypothetical protein
MVIGPDPPSYPACRPVDAAADDEGRSNLRAKHLVLSSDISYLRSLIIGFRPYWIAEVSPRPQTYPAFSAAARARLRAATSTVFAVWTKLVL